MEGDETFMKFSADDHEASIRKNHDDYNCSDNHHVDVPVVKRRSKRRKLTVASSVDEPATTKVTASKSRRGKQKIAQNKVCMIEFIVYLYTGRLYYLDFISQSRFILN